MLQMFKVSLRVPLSFFQPQQKTTISPFQRGFNERIHYRSSFLLFFCHSSTTVIASLLHNILLCQPGIGSLEKISKFLEIISYRSKDNDLLDSLCQNKNTYDIIEPQGFIKYGSDSCTLQIYAAFIRLYILPNKERKLSIKQLTEIIQSTFLFMRNSFLKLPKWLATEKRGSCLCRVRLFGAVVTLFYVYLLYWIEHPQEIGNMTKFLSLAALLVLPNRGLILDIPCQRLLSFSPFN